MPGAEQQAASLSGSADILAEPVVTAKISTKQKGNNKMNRRRGEKEKKMEWTVEGEMLHRIAKRRERETIETCPKCGQQVIKGEGDEC